MIDHNSFWSGVKSRSLATPKVQRENIIIAEEKGTIGHDDTRSHLREGQGVITPGKLALISHGALKNTLHYASQPQQQPYHGSTTDGSPAVLRATQNKLLPVS